MSYSMACLCFVRALANSVRSRTPANLIRCETDAQLRCDSHLRLIPVIFYTAHYHEREAQKLALDCGVAHVVVKPSPAAHLLRAVEQVMAGIRESDPDRLADNFDRDHLRRIAGKVSERAAALAALSVMT